jgi:competence ComEA-like helix-hairpin-helix protein
MTGPPGGTLSLNPAGAPVELRCLPVSYPDRGPLPAGWEAHLGDARTQTIKVQPGMVALNSSSARHPMEVVLPICELDAVRKVRISLSGRRSEEFTGEVPVLVVDFLGEDGSLLRGGAEREPLVTAGQDLSKQHTLSDLPTGVSALRVRLRGRFAGRVGLTRLALCAYPDYESQLRAQGPMDINDASVEQMQKLPGIGRVTAERIVDHRREHGPFASVHDLSQVNGIGPKTLDEIRTFIKAGGKH